MVRPPAELEIMFIDMDAFFASVEQMDEPALRGRPVAVTPVLTGTGLLHRVFVRGAEDRR